MPRRSRRKRKRTRSPQVGAPVGVFVMVASLGAVGWLALVGQGWLWHGLERLFAGPVLYLVATAVFVLPALVLALRHGGRRPRRSRVLVPACVTAQLMFVAALFPVDGSGAQMLEWWGVLDDEPLFAHAFLMGAIGCGLLVAYAGLVRARSGLLLAVGSPVCLLLPALAFPAGLL